MTNKPWSIVGLGEILWDIFPDGPRFGGAPGNFACSTAELAGDRAQVHMVSRVGNDELGSEAISQLGARGVQTSAVQSDQRETGRVLVEINSTGVADYRFTENCAWDYIEPGEVAPSIAASCDAVCFGTLGQRCEVSRRAIRQFLEAVPSTCLRVLDINLRTPFDGDDIIRQSLPLGNILKLNDDELSRVASLLSLSGSDREVLQALLDRYSYELVALTRGSNGALLVSSAGELSDLPAGKVTIRDTVGAGDAYTAALVLGLLSGSNLDEINSTAIQVAGYVCSRAGATMSIPPELRWCLFGD